MTWQVLLVHHGVTDGENHGVHAQHVLSLQDLFAPDPEWNFVDADMLHPALADAALSADLVVVQMVPFPEIESLIQLRRERGLATIFEITDNFLSIGDWLKPTAALRSPLVRQNLVSFAASCDALQVYTPRLAQLFGSVSRHLAVFDPYVPIPAAVPPKPPGFVFGWGGTKSHRQDLASIAPVVKDFCARHDDAVFAYMGDAAMFDSFFSEIPRAQIQYRPFGTHEEYLEFVRGLHVGLGPLQPFAFNVARTDTKFATYAAYGAAAILEDTPPQNTHAELSRLYTTPEECARILEELYRDRAQVAELARRAHAWASRERSAEKVRAQREELYRRFLPSQPGGAALTMESPSPLAERLSNAIRGERAAVPDACRELLREAPNYGQAQWVLARTLEALGHDEEALAFADSIEPPELYADFIAELQTRLARRLQRPGADAYLARIRSPLRRLRLTRNETSEPMAFFRAVLEHHPYDFFALAAMIQLLSRSAPDSPELDALFARASLVDPSIVPPERRPPELTPYLPV